MLPRLRGRQIIETIQRHRQGLSHITLIIICVILAMVASLVFRWRVFTAGSKYAIFLVALLLFLVWVGRFTKKR
jgi:ABC-type multidrug transport system permease subunit